MKYNRLKATLFSVCLILTGLLIARCTTHGSQSPKFQQYFAHGQELYLANCSNCHQKDGTGLGLLYPPLNKSDFMDEHTTKTICIIRNGMSGEMLVNGKKFNHEMPGLPLLTELEIAEITTYIYNAWGREHALIDVKEISGELEHCQ